MRTLRPASRRGLSRMGASIGANLGGTGTPIGLEAGFRHNTATFKLFGFLPLLTIKIR